MVFARFLLVIILGYLLGSIPFGVLFARVVGVDVKKMGSGKTGATNVLRSAGPGAGILAMVCDAAKGAAPVILAQHLLATPAQVGTIAPWIAATGGLCAILGHNYPIFARFQGGRGVAATGGMALALALLPTLFVLPLLIIPVVLTRYVSLGSIIGASGLPIMYAAWWLVTHTIHADSWLVTRDFQPAFFLALLIAALAIDISHRDNIDRIRKGTERKIGDKAQPAT